MADQPFDLPHAGPADRLRAAVAEVMAIESVTLGAGDVPLRIAGRLLLPADRAFAQLRPPFEALGYTPHLRREDGQDVMRALPTVFGRAERRTPWLAILLLILTLLSVFFVGLQGELYVSIWDVLAVRLTGNTALFPRPDLLPTDAQLGKALLTGLLYMLALVGILGTHEMGHYLMARHHKVHTTVPFFIPMPFNILGTLGAVIAMREPAPNRRVQFDIGIAGPLAGLIVAVPVMIAGLMLSEVKSVGEVIASLPPGVGTAILYEGQSIAYLALKFLVFGRILPQGDLDVWIHPVAFAAWAGLLVTALNLLPIGQLDGGHILYGLFGEKARLVRWPIVLALLVLAGAGSLAEAGIVDLGFGWSGWWIWIFMIVLLLRRHAPVLDEITELDAGRKALGMLMLIIFILIFTPRPLVVEAQPLAALLRGLL